MIGLDICINYLYPYIINMAEEMKNNKEIEEGEDDEELDREKRLEEETKLRMRFLKLKMRSLSNIDILLLGDAYHGDTSVEMLIEYKKKNEHFKINKLFLEHLHYRDEGNPPKSKIKIIETLKGFCHNIIGLETSQTSDDLLKVEGLMEAHKVARCTVTLPVWSEIIHRELKGGLNIACVGTSHLVQVEEEGKTVAALSSSLEKLGSSSESYAVCDWEETGVAEEDDWWSARGNKYTPNTSVESLPFLQAIDTDLVGNPLTWGRLSVITAAIEKLEEGGKKKKTCVLLGRAGCEECTRNGGRRGGIRRKRRKTRKKIQKYKKNHCRRKKNKIKKTRRKIYKKNKRKSRRSKSRRSKSRRSKSRLKKGALNTM